MFPQSISNNNVIMNDKTVIKADVINDYLRNTRFTVHHHKESNFIHTIDSEMGETSKIKFPYSKSKPKSITSSNQVLLDNGTILSTTLMQKIYDVVKKSEGYASMGDGSYNKILIKKPVEGYTNKLKMAGPGSEHYQALNINRMTPFHTANGDKYFRVGNAYNVQ